MKIKASKIIIIGILLVLFSVSMLGCRQTERNAICAHGYDDQVEFTTAFEDIHGIGQDEFVRALGREKAFWVNSVQEFLACWDAIKTMSRFKAVAADEAALLARYDQAFFDTKSLLFLEYDLGGSQPVPQKICCVKRTQDGGLQVCLDIRYTKPYTTLTQNGKHYVLELDKSEAGKSVERWTHDVDTDTMQKQ